MQDQSEIFNDLNSDGIKNLLTTEQPKMKIVRRMSTFDSENLKLDLLSQRSNNSDSKQLMRDEVMAIIQDEENSLENVTIVHADEIHSDQSKQVQSLLPRLEIEEDLGIGDNLHMKLPDKSDEVDMHFNNIISTLD